MPRVAITGATGYLGGYLCRLFLSRGWSVVALSRHRPSCADVNACQWVKWSLGEPLPTLPGAHLTCLVHVAHDAAIRQAAESWAVNVLGAQTLFDSMPRGLRLVYVSSIAASSKTKQRYAAQKLAIEEMAIALGGAILRSGLIVGEPGGGMVGKLARIPQLPVLPVPAAGAKQYTTHIDVVGAAIWEMARGLTVEPVRVTIATSDPLRFGDLLKQLLPNVKVVVPVPWRAVWVVLRGLEMVGVPLRFGADSLLGLATCDYEETEVSIVSIPPKPLGRSG